MCLMIVMDPINQTVSHHQSGRFKRPNKKNKDNHNTNTKKFNKTRTKNLTNRYKIGGLMKRDSDTQEALACPLVQQDDNRKQEQPLAEPARHQQEEAERADDDNRKKTGDCLVNHDYSYKKTGIKSKKLKYLVHPLDHLERNILIAFAFAIVFIFIALVTGLPTVMVLVILSLPILSIQHFIYYCANLICKSKIYHKCELFDFILGKHNNDKIDLTGKQQSKNNNNNNTTTINGSDGSISTRKEDELKNDWKYCPLDYLESYWFKPNLINQCILFTEQGLTLAELRKIIHERILVEPEFKKFKSRVVAKRFIFSSLFWEFLPNSDCQLIEDELPSHQVNINDSGESITPMDPKTSDPAGKIVHHPVVSAKIQCNTRPGSIPSKSSDSSYGSNYSMCISMEDVNSKHDHSKFSIEDHIIQDEPIESKKSLRKRCAHLLNVPLKLDKPLWQIRLAVATYTNQCVIFVRCHQSLADGSRLIAILVKCGLLNAQNDDSISDQSDEARPVIPNIADVEAGLGRTNEMSSPQNESFKRRFVNNSSSTTNILRACIVGPLTCFLWFIWTFSRRNYNHFKPISSVQKKSKEININYLKRFYMKSYDYAKLIRIKQVTRSTISEVILCALCGALREYLRRKCYVDRPPNLNIGLTVDMRRQINLKSDPQNVQYVLVNVPLPTAVEGAIPRLWETRHIMEELRSSADPWVMLGFQYFLFALLPRTWYVWLVNFIAHRNSSIFVSSINHENIKMAASTVHNNSHNNYNNNGSICDLPKLTIGTKKITKIYYCLQPPTERIPISFNCITYNDCLFVTCSSNSVQIDDSKTLVALFFRQLNQLSSTIAKRRIPGTPKIVTQPIASSSVDHTNLYQFRPQSIADGLGSDDLFRLINLPMTNLTSSISADFIDKYSKMIGSCDCDNCLARNVLPKRSASSVSTFLARAKTRSFSHIQYCDIHNRRSSCELMRSLKAPAPPGSSASSHGKSSPSPSSVSASRDTCDRLNVNSIKDDITDRRSKKRTIDMTSSLSHLEDLASQRSIISGSPTPTAASRGTFASEGPVDLVRRQINQLMGDMKRRRSLATVTEHHHGVQRVPVQQENDEIGEGTAPLRYPTNRRLSVIGLAVGPGRRSSLVPFGSIAHPGLPKSHSGSNETQV